MNTGKSEAKPFTLRFHPRRSGVLDPIDSVHFSPKEITTGRKWMWPFWVPWRWTVVVEERRCYLKWSLKNDQILLRAGRNPDISNFSQSLLKEPNMTILWFFEGPTKIMTSQWRLPCFDTLLDTFQVDTKPNRPTTKEIVVFRRPLKRGGIQFRFLVAWKGALTGMYKNYGEMNKNNIYGEKGLP